MKAHEQNWTLHPFSGDITNNEGRTIANTNPGTPADVESLIAAAPDMARALISGADIFDAEACWCDGGRKRHDPTHPFCNRARTALRKAGVL